MSNGRKHSESQEIAGKNIRARVVLTLESSLTHENCHGLKERIDDAIQQNKTEIILDCKKAAFLDSSALEYLIQAHNGLKGNGGALKIIGLNGVCRDILVATRLINFLYVYADIHSAVTNRPS